MRRFFIFFVALLFCSSLFSTLLFSQDTPPNQSSEIIVKTSQSPDSALFSGGSVLIARGYSMRQLSNDNWIITTTPRELNKGEHIQIRMSIEKHDSTEIHLSGLILFFQGSHSEIRTIDYQGKNTQYPEAWTELYSIAREIHGGKLGFSRLKKR